MRRVFTPPLESARLQIEIVRLRVPRRRLHDGLALCRQQVCLQGAGHTHRDVTLHREEIVHLAVIALGPEVRIAGRLDQLHIDAHPAAEALHAAFENVRNAERCGDLREPVRRVAIGFGGGARDDLEGLDARQRRQNLVLHAIGEIAVAAVLAHVGKRKNRDRGVLRHERLGAPRLDERPPQSDTTGQRRHHRHQRDHGPATRNRTEP